MSKSNDNKPITAKKFMKEFNRYQKGSISRRQFMGITGLGTAMAVMGAAVPSLWSGKAHAFGDLRVVSRHMGHAVLFPCRREAARVRGHAAVVQQNGRNR